MLTGGIAPVAELNTLRYGRSDNLSDVCPYSCEVNLTADFFKAGKLGVRVCLNENEFAEVYYDAENGVIVFDSSTTADKYDTGKLEHAPFKLKDGEAFNLTVYVDRSMVEVFANDRQAVTRRIFANGKNEPKLEVINTTSTTPKLTAWNMMETNPY